MRFKSMAKDLKGTVKEILGTAFSTGCQVDGKSPKEISDAIEAGEIESEFFRMCLLLMTLADMFRRSSRGVNPLRYLISSWLSRTGVHVDVCS